VALSEMTRRQGHACTCTVLAIETRRSEPPSLVPNLQALTGPTLSLMTRALPVTYPLEMCRVRERRRS
jgi:hypothetical protein